MRRVWSIILLICIIAPFVQTASGGEEKKGVGKYFNFKRGKEKAGTSKDLTIGVFKSTDAAITAENCAANCKTHFGEIVAKDGNRIPFAQPSLSSDKKSCSCLLNTERIKDFLVVQKLSYETFLHWIQKGSFCTARVWLNAQEVNVEIPYEMEAKKQKQSSPAAKSPAGSPQRAADTSKKPAGTDEGKGVAGTSQLPAGTAKGKGVMGTSTEPTETTEKSEGTSPKLIAGAFTSTGSAFTPESCKANCRTAFGYLIPYPGNRLPLAQPSVSADGMTCSCLVNIEPITDWCIEKNKNYEELIEKFQSFYCAGKNWFEQLFIPVELAYEEGLRPKKSLLPDAGGSKGAAGPSKGATGSGKDGEEPKVLMGTLTKMINFKTVTIEKCKAKCNKKFGFIVMYPGQLLSFTVPSISADGKGCDCLLNAESIQGYFVERHLKYENFLHWCKSSYEDALKHLTALKINVAYVDKSGKIIKQVK